VTASAWTFGWEGLVALFTLLLAVGTFSLAWVTRTLARTTAREVQSQTRPILVPVKGSFGVGDTGPEPPFPFEINMHVRNIGAGPALAVRAYVGPVETLRRNPYAYTTVTNVLAPDESEVLTLKHRLSTAVTKTQ
jgi:hypothetical protein